MVFDVGFSAMRGQLFVPGRAEFLLDQGDFLPGKGAVQLRLAHGLVDAFAQVGDFGRDFAAPDDAVDASFGVAAAGAEIQAAIGANIEAGDIQRFAGGERFHFGVVACRLGVSCR